MPQLPPFFKFQWHSETEVSKLLSLTAHRSINVNIKHFFIPNVSFISGLFYLLSPLPFSLIVVSLATQTLSLLFLTLSLSLILVSLRQMLRWWRNKAWLRSAWEPVAGIRGFWWSGFTGFHRSHFLLSFSFTGLLSFTFFFHPKRKTLRFWVWV